MISLNICLLCLVLEQCSWNMNAHGDFKHILGKSSKTNFCTLVTLLHCMFPNPDPHQLPSEPNPEQSWMHQMRADETLLYCKMGIRCCLVPKITVTVLCKHLVLDSVKPETTLQHKRLQKNFHVSLSHLSASLEPLLGKAPHELRAGLCQHVNRGSLH